MTAEIEFAAGDVTTDMVRGAWKEIIEELGAPGSEANAEVMRLGVDPHSISFDDVTVKEKSNDVGLTILVSIASPVVAHILKGLWDDLVRPRIRRKFGVDVTEELE